MKDNRQERRGESGQALILVTIVLLLATLVVPPLLGVNFSGTRSAQINEERTLRFHAADAGVEDALFKLTRKIVGNGTDVSYTLAGGLNNADVDVTIDDLGDTTYKITSTSEGLDGVPTTVESYVRFKDYTFLTDYALVTNGALTTQPGTVVDGDVRYDSVGSDLKGVINGNATADEPVENWPDTQDMIDFYWADVDGLAPVTTYVINGVPDLFGPKYIFDSGNPVQLSSKKNKDGVLQGTVYARGDLQINLKMNSELDLNGQTIFVEGDFQTQPATPLFGPGCIIATGDIQFQPAMQNDGFVFVLSLGGSISMQPSGDFYGSLAGANGINVQPGGDIINPENPPEDLHLPGMDEETREVREILNYTIKTD
jgi:hypothetical protein